MLDQKLAERIRSAVDEGFDEQVRCTAELVRSRSLMGEEEEAQTLMADAMARCGLVIDRWRIDPVALEGMSGFSPPEIGYERAYNVVGTHRVERPRGRSIILNGHVDVVPTGPAEHWLHPPFGAVVEDGWMYGRGAADMKAGTVSCVFALAALRRAGVQPASDVFVQSVIEEESTGNGTLACVERGYRADVALVPEPTSTTYVGAQVGLMWFEILIEGDPRHPSVAGKKSANAIEKTALILDALRRLEESWNAPAMRHPAFAGQERPIVISAGKIAGGDWTSSVPAWCRLEIRVGIYPGWERDWVTEQIRCCVAAAAASDAFLSRFPPKVRPRGQYGLGYVLEGADDALDRLASHHRQCLGSELLGISATGSSDARILGHDGGVPAILYGPVGRNYHGYDEAVELDSVRRVTQVMALFVADWCGVEESSGS